MPDDPIDAVIWPTADEQLAARAEGCTCAIVQNRGPDPVDDAEQDPFCGWHGDRFIMRAALRKAYA